MTDTKDQARSVHPGRFIIDSQYLKAQADEAVHRFFAPLSVVFTSAFGPDVVVTAAKKRAAGGAKLKVGRYRLGGGGRKRSRKKAAGK